MPTVFQGIEARDSVKWRGLQAKLLGVTFDLKINVLSAWRPARNEILQLLRSLKKAAQIGASVISDDYAASS